MATLTPDTSTSEIPASTNASNSMQVAIDQSNKDVNKPSMVKKIPKTKNNTLMVVVVSLLVVIAGVATGWALSNTPSASTSSSPEGNIAPGAEESATEAGIMDESEFEKEAPIGILTTGSIEGEGTHYLERDAGESKRVYLTSTVLDLQSFEGKKVQVWGNTVASQNAPWLLDVGKIKVIE